MLHKNIWNPWQIFDQSDPQHNKYSMIILNCPITIPCTSKFILDLWNNGKQFKSLLLTTLS